MGRKRNFTDALKEEAKSLSLVPNSDEAKEFISRYDLFAKEVVS